MSSDAIRHGRARRGVREALRLADQLADAQDRDADATVQRQLLEALRQRLAVAANDLAAAALAGVPGRLSREELDAASIKAGD